MEGSGLPGGGGGLYGSGLPGDVWVCAVSTKRIPLACASRVTVKVFGSRRWAPEVIVLRGHTIRVGFNTAIVSILCGTCNILGTESLFRELSGHDMCFDDLLFLAQSFLILVPKPSTSFTKCPKTDFQGRLMMNRVNLILRNL